MSNQASPAKDSTEAEPSLPPQPPPVTDRDRGTFKERLQRILKEKDTSGRRLEDKIGMATGTLSKLYNGRVALSLKMLREIGTALEVPPLQLVEGTALAHLLLGAPDLPEFAELQEVHKEIDRLRAECAEKNGAINALHQQQGEISKEQESLRRDLAAAQLAQKEAVDKHNDTATALRSAQTAADERAVTIKRIKRELEATRKQLDDAKKVADSNIAEIERLKSENVAKDSVIKNLQKESTSATRRAEEATRIAEKTGSEAKELRSKLVLSEKQRLEAEARASTAEENAAALNARLTTTESTLNAWRNEAIERRKREAYLNAEVERLNATVQQKDASEGMKLLLAGFGSLGLGIAIGSENKRSRR